MVTNKPCYATAVQRGHTIPRLKSTSSLRAQQSNPENNVSRHCEEATETINTLSVGKPAPLFLARNSISMEEDYGGRPQDTQETPP